MSPVLCMLAIVCSPRLNSHFLRKSRKCRCQYLSNFGNPQFLFNFIGPTLLRKSTFFVNTLFNYFTVTVNTKQKCKVNVV